MTETLDMNLKIQLIQSIDFSIFSVSVIALEFQPMNIFFACHTSKTLTFYRKTNKTIRVSII